MNFTTSVTGSAGAIFAAFSGGSTTGEVNGAAEMAGGSIGAMGTPLDGGGRSTEATHGRCCCSAIDAATKGCCGLSKVWPIDASNCASSMLAVLELAVASRPIASRSLASASSTSSTLSLPLRSPSN